MVSKLVRVNYTLEDRSLHSSGGHHWNTHQTQPPLLLHATAQARRNFPANPGPEKKWRTLFNSSSSSDKNLGVWATSSSLKLKLRMLAAHGEIPTTVTKGKKSFCRKQKCIYCKMSSLFLLKFSGRHFSTAASKNSGWWVSGVSHLIHNNCTEQSKKRAANDGCQYSHTHNQGPQHNCKAGKWYTSSFNTGTMLSHQVQDQSFPSFEQHQWALC